MSEQERAEVDAASDAIEALQELAGGQTFPFRIGAADAGQWARLSAPLGCLSVPPELGVERFELVRCSTNIVQAVMRRVVAAARDSAYSTRCCNAGDGDSPVDRGVSGSVIYLLKYAEISTDFGPEEPTVPSVPRAKSGTRSKVRSVKTA